METVANVLGGDGSETDRYVRQTTYNISCIVAVIVFTSIFQSDGRQICYNSQIIELLIFDLLNVLRPLFCALTLG